MNLSRLDLNLLIAFDALMTELNVSKAAEKLFIGQSAMSHSLNRLRQTFDDPILVRTTGGMKPTERAKELIEPIRKALLEIEAAVSAKQAFDPLTVRHDFVIAASDYGELILLPSLLKHVREFALGIKIQVKRPSEFLLEQELENGNLSVVISFDASMEISSRIRQQGLFDDFLVSVVRKDHPFIADSVSLEQYIELEHVLISPDGSSHEPGIIDQWLSQEKLSRNVVLYVSHFLSAPLIIAQTDLILTLPYRIAEKLAHMATLKLLRTPIDLPSYQYSMNWHPLYEKDPAQQWLRAQIDKVGRQLANSPIPPQYLP